MIDTQRLSYLVTKIVLLSLASLLATAAASAQVWTVIGAKSKGTSRDPSLPEAAQLSYRYDKQQDVLWFRVSLYGKPNEQAFGVNIVLDTGGDEADKMNWWGANKSFKFDKLVTAWVTRGNNGYQGTIGIADAAGAKAKQFNNLAQNNPQILVEGDSIVIGLKRTDLTDKMKMNLIAAVGSNQESNDDLPRTGSATIDLAAERPKFGVREIDVSRNNLQFPSDYKTLRDDRPPTIRKSGIGKQTLILVPGMYSGLTSFDGFIARNQKRYKFYIVTPAGINGTPARVMPAPGTSYGELTWTRELERDILDLIRREKMIKPVIVAERQPGAQAAIELAIKHPDHIGGVVLVAANLVQFFPSPKDPTRKSPISFSDRLTSVEEGWAAKWFKYVTPETWRSGDLPAAMLSVDSVRAAQAWQELEAAPLPVKIRYLCEFWASDVTRDFNKLQVPVLAMVPAFDEKFLAEPANGFAKTAFLDSWETLVPKHSMLEIQRIPDARLLLLDDQPSRTDEVIGTFVEKLGKAEKRNGYLEFSSPFLLGARTSRPH